MDLDETWRRNRKCGKSDPANFLAVSILGAPEEGRD